MDKKAPIGKVIIHEVIILYITFKLIAVNPRAIPTPKIAPTRV